MPLREVRAPRAGERGAAGVVMCAWCGDERRIASPAPHVTERILREDGWRQEPVMGWTCPACVSVREPVG